MAAPRSRRSAAALRGRGTRRRDRPPVHPVAPRPSLRMGSAAQGVRARSIGCRRRVRLVVDDVNGVPEGARRVRRRVLRRSAFAVTMLLEDAAGSGTVTVRRVRIPWHHVREYERIPADAHARWETRPSAPTPEARSRRRIVPGPRSAGTARSPRRGRPRGDLFFAGALELQQDRADVVVARDGGVQPSRVGSSASSFNAVERKLDPQVAGEVLEQRERRGRVRTHRRSEGPARRTRRRGCRCRSPRPPSRRARRSGHASSPGGPFVSASCKRALGRGGRHHGNRTRVRHGGGIAPRLIHSTTPSRKAELEDVVRELLPAEVRLRAVKDRGGRALTPRDGAAPASARRDVSACRRPHRASDVVSDSRTARRPRTWRCRPVPSAS